MKTSDLGLTTVETAGLRTEVALGVGGFLKSHRLLIPGGPEVPLLMEQPTVAAFHNLNWDMLYPGRTWNGTDFGTFRYKETDYWIGDPADAGNQLNGIHGGQICHESWHTPAERKRSDRLMMSFNQGRTASEKFLKTWPFPALSACKRYQHVGQSLQCTEKFSYGADGGMPFARGSHFFFPHVLDGIGDCNMSMPTLIMQADAVHPKRKVAGVDVEILLPDGAPQPIPAGDRLDFSQGKPVPLDLDTGFRLVPGQNIVLTWVGSRYVVRLTISVCAHYGYVVLYSPTNSAQFGSHFALEWQTAAPNFIHLHNQGVEGIGYQELTQEEPIELNWSMTATWTKMK